MCILAYIIYKFNKILLTNFARRANPAKVREFGPICSKPNDPSSIFFLKTNFANYRRTKGDIYLKSMCNHIYIFTGINIFWSQVSTPFGSPVICKIRFKKKHRWRFAGFRANASEFAQFRANFFAIHTAVYSLYLNIYHWIANIVGDIVALGYILCLIKNPNIKKN